MIDDDKNYYLGAKTSSGKVLRIGHPLMTYEMADQSAKYTAKNLSKDPDASIWDAETREMVYLRDVKSFVVLTKDREMVGIEYEL